ncbi:MAG: hypothetical protein KY454_13175 [Actinobacteria bacterium]|nr:hypothetical protein [Actinomycetota bacterium]MBW3651400.1 hypothetical protein [Actinomycetota bacterium]
MALTDTMNDSLDPRDELTDRLRALGRQPVDPALQSQHLTRMAGVSAGSTVRGALASRLRVGAALLGGFLLGTTGLATAGALGPLQPIAATGVEAVTPLEVPKGKSAEAKEKAAAAKAARAADKAAKEGDDDDSDDDGTKVSRLADGSIGTARYWQGCVPTSAGGTTFAGNRGLYLKQERAKGDAAYAVAKASDCGKPLDALDDDDADDAETKAPKDTSADKGKATEDEGKTGDDGEPTRGASTDKRPATTPASPERPNDRHANDRAKAGAANSSGRGQSGSHVPDAPAEGSDD